MTTKEFVDNIYDVFLKWEINPKDVVFDGKIKRLGKLWYIATHTKSYTDKPITLVTIGDWSTGEKHYYVSKEKLEQPTISLVVPYREQKWDDNQRASKRAYYRWTHMERRGESRYFQRKSISHGLLHYARYGLYRVSIPTIDIYKHIWGFQTIYDDGEKKFVKHQRVEGCFHFVEGVWPTVSDRTVLLTEGYATGCSLRLATVLPVCVAFSASNLALVAHQLCTHFPGIQLVVVGDNDHKTKNNPGVSYATDTFLEYGSNLIYPSYEDALGGTDFNDVHVNRGLPYLKSLLGIQLGVEHVRLQENPSQIETADCP